MTAIIAMNQGRAEYGSLQASDATQVESISAESAPEWITQNQACVLDVREPWEYATGHIRDAVSIPQADLAIQLTRLSPQRTMLVVCQSGRRSLAAAEFLKARGFDHAANLEGGMLAWTRTANEVLI